MRKSLCTWFGEVGSCCCLLLAYNILTTMYEDFFSALYARHGLKLGCLHRDPSACRERFCVFTFRTCFMTQPVGRAAYCQSKARYCWNIFRNISPYDLIGHGVDCLPAPIHHNFLSYKACLYPFQSTSQNYWQHQSLNFTSFSTKLTVSSMRGTLTSS